MDKTRLTCAASNFQAGRPSGMHPQAVVLHRTGGSVDEIRTRFQNGATAMSAHYVVGRSGDLFQYVDEKDTAFHAGIVVNPTWLGLKPNVNPNYYTIGIEFEGSSGDPFQDDQLEVCAALVAEIAARWNLSIDPDHIVLHSEIRASRDCPGTQFDRTDFLQRALLTASRPNVVSAPGEVNILKETNLREGLPSSSARIVSVFTPGSKIQVSAFTLQGEAIQGSAAWWQTADGNFFWAGNSSIPQPGAPPEPEPPLVLTTTSAPVCQIGITAIDQFFGAAACAPLELANSDRDTVGVIQDLLTGHGFSKLPNILSPSYGACGDLTRTALCDFQNSCGLTPNANLTTETLKQLIVLPAKDPRATRAHFSLVLGIPFSGIHRLLALTAQMEGIGKFAALNLNTDSAGLSFGLIQWAQSQRRLLEIVSAFRADDGDTFVRIFGDGDQALSDGLVAHLAKPAGGVTSTGVTIDPQFNLVASPWVERFKEAALQLRYQKVQVDTARKAFENSLANLRKYDTAVLVKSERAVAFMLDVANQFGDGNVLKPPPPKPDRGLAGLYRRVFRAGMSEHDLLQAIADATIAAMPVRLQNGVRARRTLFLTTKLLSDTDEFHSTLAAGETGP